MNVKEINKNRIRLNYILINAKKCISINFDYDKEIISRLKNINGTKWSSSKRCWYMKATPENLKSLYQAFKGRNYIEDDELFNKKKDTKSGFVTVYVEGETDEKYFKKTMDVFNLIGLKVDFKWIGRINENGVAENSGTSALNKAKTMFQANPHLINGRVILLYDSDANKNEAILGNLEVKSLPFNDYNNIYRIGIENLLNLAIDFDKSKYYVEKLKTDKYGAESLIRELDKRKLCNFICNELNIEEQSKVLINLKNQIFNFI